MKLPVIFMFLFLVGSCCTSYARQQNYQFNKLSMNDGLSNNTVLSILRDHIGFMWFGTHEGLTRFDGYEFTHYLHDRDDPETISNNKIFNIHEDHNGNIWIGTSSGLNLYVRATDSFIRYMHDPEDPYSLSHNAVRIIYEDSSGILWVGTLGGGLNRYIPESGRFVHYSFPDRNISSILEDRHGNLWIGSSAPGLFLLDKDRNEFTWYPFPHDEICKLKMNTGKTLYEDRHGNMWVCTEGAGLFLFDNSKKVFTRHFFNERNNGLNSNIISDIFLDDDDILWIATDGGGINLMELSTGKFSYLVHDFQDPRSLSSNGIYTFHRDPEGIIWAGTFGEGINVMSPYQQIFRFFTQKGPESTSSLSHKSVLSFAEDSKGIIWIGTGEGGLNRFDPKSGEFKSYMHKPGDPFSIGSNTVTSILEDSGGNLWVGTFAGGLNRFDPAGERFYRHNYEPADSNSIGDNNVWKILEDSEGTLWVGMLNGLEIMDIKNNKFVKIPPAVRNGDVFPTRILSLFEDSRGNIWVGSKGPAILDKKTMSYSFIDEGVGVNLSEFDVRDFYEDRKGFIWIASEGGGLFRYDPESGNTVNYTGKDGLPNDAIHQIIPDGYGYLWLSTNNGISRFNPETETFRNFDANDGLQSNLFSYSASLLCSTGEIYFGGVNGFNIFNPGDLREDGFGPQVYITDFALFNKPIKIGGEDSPLKVHVSQTEKIKLPFRSVFTFRFTAINSLPTRNNQFRYKLEGFDDWNDVGQQRMATYTNMRPGKYTFRVMAANNDGAWGDTDASIEVTILPPFWMTLWAYGLYLITLAAITYFIITYIRNRQKHRLDLLISDMDRKKAEEMNQMKLRFFTDIAHEFRTPLNLILGPLDKIMTSESDIEPYLKKHLNMMGRNAGRLLRLVNELMEFRKIDMGKIKLSLVKSDMIGFIYEIKSVFDEHARQNNIRYIFTSHLEVLETWIDKEKLEKVIYNILSNCFKFTGEGGEIKIEIRHSPEIITDRDNGTSDGKVEIIISDTGIGIPEEDLPKIFDRFYQVKNKHVPVKSASFSGTGIGLALARELIEIHKGEISVESTPGEGTTFRIFLSGNAEYSGADVAVEYIDDDHVPQYSLGAYGIRYDEAIQEIPGENGNGFGDRKKPSLLFVEDNPDMRSYVRSILGTNYNITEADNGLEGFEKAAATMPDIIVSDVMMPVMDGIEMCKKIKKDINSSHIPVILLTSRYSEDHTIEGFDAGADDYIPKPFNPKVLDSRIRNILKLRQELRDKFRREGILQPSEVTSTSADELFLHRAMEIVEKHMGNSEFRVSVFVSEMGMSRSVLYRKFEALTGQSVNEFVKNIRLKRAAQLLALNEFNISEITYQVGFSDPQYFSKCFSGFYGMTPSQYSKQCQGKVIKGLD